MKYIVVEVQKFADESMSTPAYAMATTFAENLGGSLPSAQGVSF